MTDHAPVVLTVKEAAGPRHDDSAWRLDPTLLQDKTSLQNIISFLETSVQKAPSITPDVWESLKREWKGFLQSKGRNRKRRLTAQMAEVLRTMRIVKGTEPLTSCTRDYLASLEVKYKRLLQERTRKTSGTHGSLGETDVTADLREVCGNGSSRITQAMCPDGSTTDD
ncbi:hypothetical protein HPB51_010663 [Rhipicephalus microplus]|uniref:Uncharacterized protein n=1 Tax=Rhipicephalus microplus TaxID=6941 RepID=A0A9J6E7W9_RHIMP|nr:hypothetical protein HPB51_010663 [Rhipicephalus microplus]